ncbi:PAQR family membrane homeostasis protein TrhA [Peptostreptococcus equinus]|uniref:Hemolysin III family protein n=1 Tax=Peptostreptococcus equinus TaxID=3003601 RepID=A0ABY7JSS9_9FIRM|nr:hemolysin III family protein [Peptostreptococcus sp. CBA3647]WAW15030.1 hemolysin III family protein [Peptostreptococcus sp. CBA3647]
MNALRDPISSLTHLIGGFLSLLGLALLISKQLIVGNINIQLLVATIIFGLSMAILYFTSGIYHAIRASKEKAILVMRKLDHSMIYVLIAGSYSPFCLYVLPKKIGIPVFLILWFITIIGSVMKVMWINMPRKLSSALYIAMGWTAIFLIKDLYINLILPAFILLVLGGLFYTIGGVIYAIKKPNIKNWNFHDIFHIFIMLGSISHFLLVFNFII